MTKDGINSALVGPESDPPEFTSLILRCWRGASGQMRVRLVNVNSGVSHLVTDLDELPELVRRLVVPAGFDREDPERNR